MKDVDRVACILYLCFYKYCGSCNISICVKIARAGDIHTVGQGRSSYARRRRAIALGRCHRCYRVVPPISPLSRCNGSTCRPGLSVNERIVSLINGSNCDDTHDRV